MIRPGSGEGVTARRKFGQASDGNRLPFHWIDAKVRQSGGHPRLPREVSYSWRVSHEAHCCGFRVALPCFVRSHWSLGRGRIAPEPAPGNGPDRHPARYEQQHGRSDRSGQNATLERGQRVCSGEEGWANAGHRGRALRVWQEHPVARRRICPDDPSSDRRSRPRLGGIIRAANKWRRRVLRLGDP